MIILKFVFEKHMYVKNKVLSKTNVILKYDKDDKIHKTDERKKSFCMLRFGLYVSYSMRLL